MRSLTQTAIWLLAALLLAAVTGCPAPDPRTSNQGGGSLITVGGKLLSNPADPPIGELNPDEWQIFTDNLALFLQQLGLQMPEGVTIPPLTDEQAQEIGDFLEANNITNLSDLQALIQAILSGQIEVPEALIQILQALGVDLSGLT